MAFHIAFEHIHCQNKRFSVNSTQLSHNFRLFLKSPLPVSFYFFLSLSVFRS